MKKEIHIAAAIITRSDGQTLLVRKAGTDRFMQAGGKIDAGETPDQALSRELREELGLGIAPSALRFLKTVTERPAFEENAALLADLFHLEMDVAPRLGAEIAECAWLRLDAPLTLPLAPLTKNVCLPLARALSGAVSPEL